MGATPTNIFTLTEVGPRLPLAAIAGFWRAMEAISAVLGPANSAVRLDCELVTAPLPAGQIAFTNTVVTSALPGRPHLWEQGSVAELRTGIDPNGKDPDFRITVDPVRTAGYSEDQWYGLFLHESFHALAFNGAGPHATERVLWDTLVRETDKGPVFVGELSMGVYGGPVPLQADMLHTAAPGLMYPNALLFRPVIGPLELAMLADTGVPLAATAHFAADQNPLPVPVGGPDNVAVWMA